MRQAQNQRRNKNKPKAPRNKAFPEHLRRKDYLYLEGKVEQSSRGISHVMLENGMKALTQHRKLEVKNKVYILPGDKVVVEIDPLTLSPTEVVRGRIVWRLA